MSDRNLDFLDESGGNVALRRATRNPFLLIGKR